MDRRTAPRLAVMTWLPWQPRSSARNRRQSSCWPPHRNFPRPHRSTRRRHYRKTPSSRCSPNPIAISKLVRTNSVRVTSAERARIRPRHQRALESPHGGRSEPRIGEQFDRLVDRISTYEVRALAEGDGFTEKRMSRPPSTTCWRSPPRPCRRAQSGNRKCRQERP